MNRCAWILSTSLCCRTTSRRRYRRWKQLGAALNLMTVEKSELATFSYVEEQVVTE